jgi:hypothetical protein
MIVGTLGVGRAGTDGDGSGSASATLEAPDEVTLTATSCRYVAADTGMARPNPASATPRREKAAR